MNWLGPTPKWLRARRRTAAYYPPRARLRRIMAWGGRQTPTAHLALRLAATGVVVVHLAAAALLPGGLNNLFDWKAGPLFAYQTLFSVGDTMGFFKTSGRDGFVIYKVFNQDGGVVEGVFPDSRVAPRLRYDRWAMYGSFASEDNPEIHAAFLKFLVRRLPAPPLKVELRAARWSIAGLNGIQSQGSSPREAVLEVRHLGSFDGLTRRWRPAREAKRK